MDKQLQWDVTSLEQLDEAAADIAARLKPGQIVYLDGDMGAGKTTFVRALATHLHTTDHVSSPTFGLVQRYDADIPIIHMDLYRLETLDQILGLDLERYLDDSTAIKLIEWPSRLDGLALTDVLSLSWNLLDSEDGSVSRQLTLFYG